MAQQWERICDLPEEVTKEVRSFYSGRFPLEIRARFSKWIDEKPWNQVDENNASHMTYYACPLLKELIDMAKSSAKFEPSLKDNIRVLQEKYVTNLFTFIKDMKDCLAYEEQVLNLHVGSRGSTPISCIEEEEDINLNEILSESQKFGEFVSAIESELNDLRKKVEDFEEIKQDLHEVSEHFKTHESKLQDRRLILQKGIEGDLAFSVEVQNEIEDIEKSTRELFSNKQFITNHLLTCLKEFENLPSKLTQDFAAFLKEYKRIEERLINCDIPDWKHKQRISCNGGPQPKSLFVTIQNRTKVLCTSLIQYGQLLTKFKEIESNLPFRKPEMMKFLNDVERQHDQCIIRILESTFLVVRQPPQVLRKDMKCETSVVLAAGKLINVNIGLPKVTVRLIREQHVQSGKTKRNASTEDNLLNNSAVFDMLSDGTLTAKLKPIIDKRFKRQSKQKVADERYNLLFECCLDDSQKPLQVLSIPVMVTSNISQECECLGRIVWDHQFATQDGEIPKYVPWDQMAALINARFVHETGRGLDDKELNFIASKLLREGSSVNQYVTFEKFCKTKEGSFTFWDWIYHIIKLIKEQLHGLWIDRKLNGFVSRQEIDELLSKDNVLAGNIMTRFSDSVLGGISVVERRQNTIDHMEPLTNKNFQISPFILLVRGKDEWRYWYPNIPKDQALNKYYSEHQRKSDESDPMKKYKKFIWLLKSEDSNEEEVHDYSDQTTSEILNDFIEDVDLYSLMSGSCSNTNDMDLE